MGVMDGLRRVAGMRAGTDAGSAETLRATLSSSGDATDAFAIAIADKVVAYGPDQTARVLPELTRDGGKWNRNEDRRWADIARTAQGVAVSLGRTREHGVDQDLADAIHQAALGDAAATFGGRGMISNHADETRARLTRQVRSTLAGGEVAERTAGINATALSMRRDIALETRLVETTSEHVRVPENSDRRRHAQWLLDANRAFLAMARTGMVPTAEVVDYARATSAYGHPQPGAAGRIDHQASAATCTRKARRAMIAGEIGRSIAVADATASAAGRPAATPFRPIEIAVVQRSGEASEARARELEKLPDAEWTRTGGRRMTSRMDGMVVGERAGHELRDAIRARTADNPDHKASTNTMIPLGFLRTGTMADLQAARTGRLEEIADPAFRATIVDVARSSRQLHDGRTHDFGAHARAAEAAERAAPEAMPAAAAARPVITVAGEKPRQRPAASQVAARLAAQRSMAG